MKHQIFSLSSNDFNDPDDPTDLITTIVAVIGPSSEDNVEKAGSNFYFKVCTRKFIEREILRTGFFIADNFIVLERFSWNAIATAIDAVIGEFEDLVAKEPSVIFELALSNFAHWEFAGMDAFMAQWDDDAAQT
ncbi:MAG: Immunity protein 8 [Cyanobacteria bacterium RYN_339]|nr:Immunity protein 8 [Cyanobacteria bacterium RYN_339]